MTDARSTERGRSYPGARSRPAGPGIGDATRPNQASEQALAGRATAVVSEMDTRLPEPPHDNPNGTVSPAVTTDRTIRLRPFVRSAVAMAPHTPGRR